MKNTNNGILLELFIFGPESRRAKYLITYSLRKPMNSFVKNKR